MAIRFVHKVNAGDLISSLAGIKHLCEERGEKAIIYQMIGRPGEYFIGAKHPVVDELGNMVCFNESMYQMMKPLLEAQDYIESFEIYNGQQVDYDLDVVRQDVYCGAPNFPLQKWTWMAYPEMACDLSVSWIKIHHFEIDLSVIPQMTADEVIKIWQQTGCMFYRPKPTVILLNFTERYRNYNINYFFLKKYEDSLMFIGMEQEHEIFCKQWGLQMPYVKVENFLELATTMQSCDFFMGNQSFCWNLAQAMHIPRILELYPHAQNCTNFGANGYEFYNTKGAQYYVEKLFNQ